MAENNISLAQARGNFLTWCISGYMPLTGLCKPLFIAQALEASTMQLGQYYTVYSVKDAADLAGQGSPLASMAREHFAACPEIPLTLARVNLKGTATAAVFTWTFTGPATETGVLSFAIEDIPVQVVVIAGQTAAQIATSVATELTGINLFPFTAEASDGVVTLTSKVLGPVGSWFSPEMNPNFGDQLPPGVTATILETTPGAGTTDINSVLPVFACAWDVVGLGFEDQPAVDQIVNQIKLNWDCGVQGLFKGGHVIYPKTGTSGTIAAYAMGRNNPEESIVPVEMGYKYRGILLSAAFTSRVACSACDDPSRPIQNDNGVMGDLYASAKCSSVWTQEEIRAFYDAGVATWDVQNSSGVRDTSLVITDFATTYKFSPKTGAPDGAWRQGETRFVVAKFIRELGQWYYDNYSSVSLVNNGTRIPPGKRAISPRMLQASILSWMVATQAGNTVDASPAQLEKMVNVERTNQPGNCDPDRVNVLIDLDTVNRLARIATSVSVAPELSCRPAA